MPRKSEDIHVYSEFHVDPRSTGSVLIKDADDTIEPAPSARGQDLYFEVLELQPIKVSISFMVTGRLSSDAKYALS